jgi:diguanylate cyclase (GGDEF)-like protein/putative nucleotidyltransferase with HDIG domain
VVGPAEEAAQREDVLRRAVLAGALLLILPFQRSHVPAWEAVVAALSVALLYDVVLAYLVHVAKQFLVARVLAFILDATLMFVALLFVLRALGSADSSSDIWIAMLLFIGSGGFSLAPVGSLIYTALGTTAFILGTLLYFPEGSQYQEQLVLRVVFFVAFGLLSLGAAQELEKRRKRVLEQNMALADSKDALEEKSTQLEQALRLERERARRDTLTEALNHAAIVEELDTLIGRYRAGESSGLVVAMVDVDGLKAVNDTFGHPMGDAVLRAVAKVLDRDDALVGRYGGDEFVVVLVGANRPVAERYRSDVLASLDDLIIVDPDSGARVPVLVSIGVVCYPQEAETIEDLIKLSDSAMYASRRVRAVSAGVPLDEGRYDARTATVVSQILPLMPAPGDVRSKLQLVAKRISVAAGYDLVDIRLGPLTREPEAECTYSNIASDLVDAWHAARSSPENAYPFLSVIVATSRPLPVDDLLEDKRLTGQMRGIVEATGVKSAIFIPMVWQGEFIGAMTVGSKRLAAFEPRDAQFLTSVAAQVTAIARMSSVLEELRAKSESLRLAHVETVVLLAAAAEAHDHTTGRHLHEIRVITKALAEELGYSSEDAEALGLATVLHDIGKISVPDYILANPGALSEEEWRVMKQHTIWGAEFLAGRAEFAAAAEIAKSHHERWDGSGYPDGLSGEDIPRTATIVAVADALDALISDRPYRKGRSIPDAVAEIEESSGKQFSPVVVEALTRLAKRGELARLRGQPRIAA